MKLRVLLCILLFSATLAGQNAVPGYMGRRLTVTYSTNLMFAASPTAGSSDGGLNHSHIFGLEYGIRNRTNLCVAFRYFKTGLYSVGQIEGFGNQLPVTYAPSNRAPMQMASRSVDISFKFFHQGMLAPVGRYRKLGFLLMFNKGIYEKNAFTYYEAGRPVYTSVGPGEYKKFDFAIAYELGRQRVVADRVVISGGIRASIAAGGFFQNTVDFVFDDYSGISSGSNEYHLKREIVSNMRDRNFLHELFNIHIGIGFLAY